MTYKADTQKGHTKRGNIMKELQLNVLDTNNLKKAVTDLLTTSEAFYKLALELANLTDSDAGRIEPDDLATVAGYLDENTTYYTAELLYIAQYAMDDVAE